MRKPSSTKKPPETVSLCADGGCCPDATFWSDGSVTFQEFTQVVKLTKSSAKKLFKELKKRGYDK
jgi:hypothetical protein